MFIITKELACIVFIMGRPGSGKSLAARCISGRGESQTCLLPGWDVEHLTDYPLLMTMFQDEELADLDNSQRRFAASSPSGFVVKDFSVLPEVLVKMNEVLVQKMAQLTSPTLFLVEFARDDYGNWQDIWSMFAAPILENAYCLCLQANMQLCMSRVHERTSNKQCEHDTFVADEVMTTYYPDERFIDVQEIFGMTRVAIIDNHGEWQHAWAEISNFVHSICISRELFLRRQLVPVSAHSSIS
jgi:hypothetical protein